MTRSGFFDAFPPTTADTMKAMTEEVRPIDEFPRTPSGKIQKFVLRDRLRRGG